MKMTVIKKGRKLKFRKLESVVNPKSVHGIYPYRGKISALDAKQIIDQLPTTGLLLDPFCGSGTIVYEARKHGLEVVGVDSNPIAHQITKAKFCDNEIALSLFKVNKIIMQAKKEKQIKKMPEKALKYFHEETAKQVMSLLSHYDELDDYEKGTFLGAICLAARGCNQYKWSSTQIGKIAEEKNPVNFYEKFLAKLKKHHAPAESDGSMVILGDTRKIGNYVSENSVDFVYTSPPYFDGLDYTSNYTRIVHNIFDNNVSKIKDNLIQKFDSYEDNVRKCFNELVKVTKEDALIIFVVGDKKRGKEVINGGEFFSDICDHKPNYIVERQYSGTASKIWDKINKTERKEQIIVWDRSTW